nr:hypothetical protein [Tanacetum cinerariifolium]
MRREAILHAVNHLIEDRRDDVVLSMLLVDLQNAFNLVDRKACMGISKLYFAMRTCPPRVFVSAQHSFDMDLRSALERIVTASGPGFGNLQWRLATLPFAFGGLGVYSTASGSTFDDALCVFNTSMETNFLTCSKVFTGMYGDHAVSCAGIIGLKHMFLVRDFGFKEVDIGLGGGCDKALHPADMLLYSWDGGLDLCLDLTGSSPLTQTGMADFMPGRAVIDDVQHIHGKYMAKCACIGYGFIPFSFSSLGELEADEVTLLKRIQKFSMTQDIRARATIHIFNRISFAIAKGVGAQIVSRLPFNLL